MTIVGCHGACQRGTLRIVCAGEAVDSLSCTRANGLIFTPKPGKAAVPGDAFVSRHRAARCRTEFQEQIGPWAVIAGAAKGHHDRTH